MKIARPCGRIYWSGFIPKIVVLGCLLFVAKGSPDVYWSSDGGNMKNTRYASETALDANFSFVAPSFILQTNASVSATPALIGGLVIFPTWDGHLEAYREAGGLKWKKNIAKDYYGVRSFSGSNASSHVYVSETTPTALDERYAVIGISGPADILIFRYDTGFLFWKKTLSKDPFAIVAQSPQVHEGKMYVGIDAVPESERKRSSAPSNFVGSAYALDVGTKSVLWQWSAAPPEQEGKSGWAGGGLGRSSPALDATSGVVYFSTGVAWKKPDAWSTCASAIDPSKVGLVCEELMYPDVYMNSVVGLDMVTGKLVVGRRFDPWRSWEEAMARGVSPESTSNIPPLGRDGELACTPTLVETLFCDCPDGQGSAGTGNGTEPRAPGLCCASEMEGEPVYQASECAVGRSEVRPVLYVYQHSGFVWALDSKALKTVWMASPFPGSPAEVDRASGIAADDQAVYLAHENFAQREWYRSIASEDDDPGSTPRCGGWTSLNRFNGTGLWTRTNPACRDPTGEPGDPLSNGRSTTARAIGPPALAGGLLFVGSADAVRSPAMGTSLVDVYGDGEEVVNVGNGRFKEGKGGWVYALKAVDGSVSSSYESGAPVFGGFALGRKCAWIGQGTSDKSQSKGWSGLSSRLAVYGFCSSVDAPVSSQPVTSLPNSNPLPPTNVSPSPPSLPSPPPPPSSPSSTSPVPTTPKGPTPSRPPYFFDDEK